MATPTATTHGPPTLGGPGPTERSLRARKRLVPLGLVAPGVSWMILFFVIPMVLLGVTSLESGGILSGGFRFTWEFSNYSHVLGLYSTQFIRLIEYSVIVTVAALLLAYGRSLEDAAQDLFASPIVAFFRVTLPLIAPGILAGFLLAFVLSLGDFVITNFVSGQVETFPIWVFGAARIGLPQVNVMGTLLFGAGVVAAILNVVAQRRRT